MAEAEGLVRRIPRAIPVMLLAAVALSLALLLRVHVIEPPEFAWVCQSATPPWWCPLRAGAILGLRAGIVGFLALACGLLALWRSGRRPALAAIALGAAGLVLYGPEPAAGGALLGALAIVRR